MSESEEKSLSDSIFFKMGLSVWLTICLFACLWFLSRFMTGRRQLRSNLHVIEDGLRRMQEEIEQRQRENSIGYGENLEELMEQLKKGFEENATEEEKEKDKLLEDEKKQDYKEISEDSECLTDKKND